MINRDNPTTDNHTTRLLLIGTALFVIYYLTDCALDSLVFGEENLYEQLFSPSAHEVSIRVLSGIFLFTLYVIAANIIHTNRSLQSELLDKSRKLETQNQELEAYNHALTHELGTSLTEIITAKEILKKRSRDCSNSVCRELLSHVIFGCDKLTLQIEGMLRFSEANRTNIDRKAVSIDNIARDIAKEIAANTKGSALDIQIDNKLESDCDPQLIGIAMKNLLDNAVKFRAADRQGEIQIGMQLNEGVPTYFIRDNGIGFEQKDADRLFRPFEKINPKNSMGTGVGLATARTIIERHGGEIWAESRPGEGSTFYFTLGSSRPDHRRANGLPSKLTTRNRHN